MELGSMAERNDDVSNGRNWEQKYAPMAFEILPLVMVNGDIISVQCLILFAYKRYWFSV